MFIENINSLQLLVFFSRMNEINNDIKNQVRNKHNFRMKKTVYFSLFLVNEAITDISLIVNFSRYCPEVYKLDRRLGGGESSHVA